MISSNAAALLISGTGSITGTGTITLGSNKTISTGTSLTINPAISISNNISVTNKGTIVAGSNITGGNNSSTWINDTNSSLTMGGTTSTLMSTGTLTATATGNTVRFNGSGAQTVKPTTYYDVVFENAGTKTIGGAATVTNSLTIQGSAQLASGANALTINGQWMNNSSADTPYSSTSTVTFNNSAATITGTGITTFNNLTIGATATLTANPLTGKIRVNGICTNDGVFDNNGSDMIFIGTTSSIAGVASTEFHDLIINAGTLTLPALGDVGIEGNLTVNATLNASTALMYFTGAGNTHLLNGSTSTQSLYKLEIDDPSGTLLLQKPVTVTNELQLTNGNIETTSINSLMLTNSTTITGGSSLSYIDGSLTHEAIGNTLSKVFPIGKAADYRPVTLNINATSSPTSNYTAELFNASAHLLAYTIPADIDRVSSIHYWNINQSNPTNFTNATATLTYGSNDEVTDASSLRMVKDNGAGAWTNIGSGGSGEPSGSITSTPFTSFSTFTLATIPGSSNPLPIVLVSFVGKIVKDQVVLNWITASELNNDYFTVEKSKDGVEFEEVQRITGAGSTNEISKYEAIDYDPYPGISYYRLLQTDYDGKFEYSELLLISFEGNFSFSAFPTVITTSLQVRFKGARNDELTLSLQDMTGRIFMNRTIVLENGSKTLQFDDFERYPAGLYIMKCANSTLSMTQPVIIK